MSNNPIDPAAESVNQGDRETNTYDGQEGYGVDFEDGQYRGGTTDADASVRNGSFETNNAGGYGNNLSDAEMIDGTSGSPETGFNPDSDRADAGVVRGTGGNPQDVPDPEAGVGQGGQ
ncbi:MAG: hypothetical protein M3R24_05495 [Chloroflexota bacterium]|nr:hypothetical protein [Chloroflexota bacterium]PLS78439.1 MAG: hypothetical protein CYG59_18190 [Chloroflexota bacterium]